MTALLEIQVPIISEDEMQEIWEAGSNSLLSIFSGGRILGTEPLYIARMPRGLEDSVRCKPVTFTILHKATLNRWSATLFGGQFNLAGKIVWGPHVGPGDTVMATLTVRA